MTFLYVSRVQELVTGDLEVENLFGDVKTRNLCLDTSAIDLTVNTMAFFQTKLNV